MGKYMIGMRINEVLKSSWRTGKLIVREPELVAVSEIKVYEANVTAPLNPVQAAIEGFLAEENPYPEGSALRKTWAKEFAKAAQWTMGYDDPRR